MPDDDEKPWVAPFPDTNSAESEAVRVLLNSCNSNKVEISTRTNDKYPNQDGYIELKDEQNRPRGILFFQLKKLPDDNINPPKIKIKTKTLGYCQVISSPFIILGADIANEILYWKHISPDWFENESLRDQDWKVLHFPTEQAITPGSVEYYDAWRELVRQNRRRIQDYGEYQRLKELANPALGVKRSEIEQYHIFLDEYNRLLDEEVPRFKQVLYSDSWRIGCAVQGKLDDPSLVKMFPIEWDENEPEIRQVDDENSLDMYLAKNEKSSILETPEEHAKRLVDAHIFDVIPKQRLRYLHSPFITREVISAFLFDAHDLMGLPWKQEYSVKEILNGYFGYLQIWVYEAMDEFDFSIKKLPLGHGYIDPIKIRDELSQDHIDEIHDRTKERLREEEKPRHIFEVGSGPNTEEVIGKSHDSKSLLLSLPIGRYTAKPILLEHSLISLMGSESESHKAPYTPAHYANLENDSPWTDYEFNLFEENLLIFASNLADSFSTLVNENFPDIASNLPLFRDVDKVLISAVPSSEIGGNEPEIQIYFLSGMKRNSVDVEYIELDTALFELLANSKEGDSLSIRGQKGSVKSVQRKSPSFYNKPSPVTSTVHSKLTRRLMEHFASDDPYDVDHEIKSL